MSFPDLTQSQQLTTTQATRYTTQKQQPYDHSQLQPQQTQSHSPRTASDVSVELTRSAPHNDSHPAAPMSFAALTESQQPTTMQATTTQQQPNDHSQLQQPPRIRSHLPETDRDANVEFTRSAPHNHSHPAAPIQLSALAQSQQPTMMQVTRYTTQELLVCCYHSL
jgi:hypothetical protein